MPNYIRQFGSLTDWINYSENDQPTDGPESERSSNRPKHCGAGIENKSDAYKLIRQGYPEGLQKMKEVLDCVRNLIRLKSPQYEFAESPEGSAPNIEAYLQGMPDDMFYLSPVEVDAPPTFLSVQLEMDYNAGVSNQQATWAGATVFAAIEALRAQGCAVQMLFSYTVSKSYKKLDEVWQATIPIPNSLDMDTLAFLFTHPAALRTILISVMEHEERALRDRMRFYHGCGYGYPAVLKNPQADVLLRIQSICQLFHYGNPAHNLQVAQTILQTLVDTKMERFQ